MSNKAWLLLLFLSLIWGSSFYFIGEGVKSVPPLTLVFYRIFFAGLALYFVLLLLRRRLPKKLESPETSLYSGTSYSGVENQPRSCAVCSRAPPGVSLEGGDQGLEAGRFFIGSPGSFQGSS